MSYWGIPPPPPPGKLSGRAPQATLENMSSGMGDPGKQILVSRASFQGEKTIIKDLFSKVRNYAFYFLFILRLKIV